MKEFKELKVDSNRDKNFILIVLTHNAGSMIEHNFRSIMNQNYDHYRVIYLDKGSTDGTFYRLQHLAFEDQSEREVTLISEEREERFFETYYRLIHECHDRDIIVHLYGTDWLAHDEVLIRLNQTYSNPNVWLSYGQYLDYPDYQRGHYEPFPKKNVHGKKVQRAPWMRAYLKTFYAGLFKQTKYEGNEHFLTIHSENDFLSSLVDRAKAHVQFIPDVLYIHYSQAIPKKAKESLTLTKDAKLEEQKSVRKVDVILFSEGKIDQLERSLRSMFHYINGIRDISVIITSLPHKEIEYDLLQTKFPSVKFAYFRKEMPIDFKKLVLASLIEGGTVPYVLFTLDQMVIRESIQLATCIQAMQKTGAYAFYLNLGHSGTRERVAAGIYSWVIGEKQSRDNLPHPFKMGLYRKIDLERDFKDMPFTDYGDLVDLWTQLLPSKRVGLSFDAAKAVYMDS